MLRVLFLLMCLALPKWAFSQVYQPCLYDHVLNLKEEKNPGFKESLYRQLEFLGKNNISVREDKIEVNVVIHVVYKNAEENLSDAKIQEQMKILNDNYSRLNADTVNLRDEFKPVAGNPNIHFNLTQIKRVQTNAVFQPTLSSLPDHVKETSKGGSDAVDPDHFLNIWICNIKPLVFFGQESPILGYAYPPDNLDNWPEGSSAQSKNLDGVVLHYKAIGIGNFEVKGIGNIPMRGRTCVHEVGHYLGLRHISGDAGIFGPDCSGSDGVDDTPSQGMQSEFDCNAAQNTCDQAVPGDLPDMIENYMDYSQETCQNSFTRGQVNIMRGVLSTHRAGITELPAAIAENDKENQILMFPNPTRDVLFFRGEVYDISVSNVAGQQLAHYHSDQIRSIDVSHLLKGLYLIKINQEKVFKLIVH